MAFEKKYYFNFKDLNDLNNIVEIYQQNTGATIASSGITGGLNPFSVELPSLNNKFQSVRGTGCAINLLSINNMEFLNGLYHIDAQEYLIKHFIGTTGSTDINWIGYMNSELMSEPYSELDNYEVSFNGNDGFALMDRFTFVDADNLHYTGITSQFQIIRLIFEKIALPFNELKICLSTTFSGQTITDTIFHQTYIDTANFINEDGDAETLRKVLDGILMPYGAFITQHKGSIIITDNHNTTTNTGFTFKKYSMVDYTALSDEAITGNTIEISSIGYAGTGSNIEISGGKNKQVICYSPYPIKEIIKNKLKDLEEFEFTGLWSGITWNWRYLLNNPNFNIYTPATYRESRKDSGSTSDVYFLYNDGSLENNSKLLSIKNNPILIIPKYEAPAFGTINPKIVYGAGIKITGEVMVRIYSLNPYEEDDINEFYANTLINKFKVKVGSMYYNGSVWTSTDSFYSIRTTNPDNTPFKNSFVGIGLENKGIIIPVDVDLSGEISFEFWSESKLIRLYSPYNYIPEIDYTLQSYYQIWFRNLSIELVKNNGEIIPSSDIEYIGVLDKNFKDEAEKVTLICGTESAITDKAKLLYNDGTIYKAIKYWTRAGNTFNIEKLLLNSLSSNFKKGSYSLSNVVLNNTINPYNILKDTTYLSDSKFMLNSYVINYSENEINCGITEISADENNII